LPLLENIVAVDEIGFGVVENDADSNADADAEMPMLKCRC
jgi:hypothetical protein